MSRGTAFVLVGLAVAAAGSVSCSPREAPLAEPAAPAAEERDLSGFPSVTVVEVRPVEAGRQRTFPGAVASGDVARLSFRVSGTLTELPAEPGSIVAEGDLLAAIDPTEYEIQVQQVEAALAEARIQTVLAESRFERTRALYERESVSEGEFEAALAAVESARARLMAAERRLESAKRQVANCRLTSPIDAIVVETPVRPNEAIEAGRPVVGLLAEAQPKVEVKVPVDLIEHIDEGMPATVRFVALRDREFRGRVVQVPWIPTDEETFPVHIELRRAWSALAQEGQVPVRPGMKVQADLRVEDNRGRYFMVPEGAVVRERGEAFVYVVKPTTNNLGKIEQRSVDVGRTRADGVEILKGLQAGEKIVSEVSSLVDEEEVRLSAVSR